MIKRMEDTIQQSVAEPGSRQRRVVVFRLDSEAFAAVCYAAEAEGLGCVSFDNARDAASAIAAEPPACLVIGAGQIPFCGQLRHHEPVRDVPVIVLVRPDDPASAALALQSGATDLAMMPVNPQEFRFRLARLRRVGKAEVAPRVLGGKSEGCQAESEIRVKQALKNMPVMVFAADEDGCILFFNPEFERVTGYSADDILRAPQALELLMPREEHLLPLLDDLPGTPPGEQHRRWTFTAKDGGERTIIWSNISERCPIQGWNKWGVGLDITEFVRLERLREEVERVVRHDLRNPLSAVVGLTELLLDDPALNGKQRGLLAHIGQAAGRMARIVENSLALYRIEQGTYVHMPVSVNIAEVARTIVTEFESVLRARGQTLRLLLDGGELLEGGAVMARTNRSLVENIVANLLKNAIEASPDGAEVGIALMSGDPVMVSVRNPGVVAPDMRDRLFRRYATNKPGGTGLGLYSAKITAEIMGGGIAWESSVEDGTTFTLSLPGQPS